MVKKVSRRANWYHEGHDSTKKKTKSMDSMLSTKHCILIATTQAYDIAIPTILIFQRRG